MKRKYTKKSRKHFRKKSRKHFRKKSRKMKGGVGSLSRILKLLIYDRAQIDPLSPQAQYPNFKFKINESLEIKDLDGVTHQLTKGKKVAICKYVYIKYSDEKGEKKGGLIAEGNIEAYKKPLPNNLSNSQVIPSEIIYEYKIKNDGAWLQEQIRGGVKLTDERKKIPIGTVIEFDQNEDVIITFDNNDGRPVFAEIKPNYLEPLKYI